MGDPLRDRRPLKELAANLQVIEISDKIGSMDRLAEVVEAELSALDAGLIPPDWRESRVIGRLQFGRIDAQADVITLEGGLETSISTVCQRCLAVFDLPIKTDVRLQLTGPDSTPVELDGFEPWELADDVLSPADIVDEALVMAIPLSAMHENSDDCIEVEAAVNDEMTRPFASLKAQMDELK